LIIHPGGGGSVSTRRACSNILILSDFYRSDGEHPSAAPATRGKFGPRFPRGISISTSRGLSMGLDRNYKNDGFETAPLMAEKHAEASTAMHTISQTLDEEGLRAEKAPAARRLPREPRLHAHDADLWPPLGRNDPERAARRRLRLSSLRLISVWSTIFKAKLPTPENPSVERWQKFI
jgi:hypothetical protein